MPIMRGSTPITDIRRGGTPINEVRRGGVLLWTRGGTSGLIRDDFNRENSDNIGADWLDEGTALRERLIGIDNHAARMTIPDGLIGGAFDNSISRMRYLPRTLGKDNGFVECRPATKGDGYELGLLTEFKTWVCGRVNVGFTNAIGMELVAGHLFIVRRVSGTDDRMADCGTFQPGDRLRLTFTENVHTLFRNGSPAGQWDDNTGTVSKGTDYQSLGIRADGGKKAFGPRRFSPALDYVMMG
jgi:hypothetical protein